MPMSAFAHLLNKATAMRPADDVPVAAMIVEPRRAMAMTRTAMKRWAMFCAPLRSLPRLKICHSPATADVRMHT
jgi:hypothetical protein